MKRLRRLAPLTRKRPSATAIHCGEPQITKRNVIVRSPAVHSNGAHPQRIEEEPGPDRLVREHRVIRAVEPLRQLASEAHSSAPRPSPSICSNRALWNDACNLRARREHDRVWRRLRSHVGVIQQLLHIPHTVGPLPKSPTPDGPIRSASGSCAVSILPIATSFRASGLRVTQVALSGLPLVILPRIAAAKRRGPCAACWSSRLPPPACPSCRLRRSPPPAWPGSPPGFPCCTSRFCCSR